MNLSYIAAFFPSLSTTLNIGSCQYLLCPNALFLRSATIDNLSVDSLREICPSLSTGANKLRIWMSITFRSDDMWIASCAKFRSLKRMQLDSTKHTEKRGKIIL